MSELKEITLEEVSKVGATALYGDIRTRANEVLELAQYRRGFGQLFAILDEESIY